MNTAVASVLADVTRRVGLGSDLFRYVRHEFYSANKDFDLHDRNGRWVLRARGGVMEFVMDDGHVRGAATHPVRDASDAVPAADGVLGVVRRHAELVTLAECYEALVRHAPLPPDRARTRTIDYLVSVLRAVFDHPRIAAVYRPHGADAHRHLALYSGDYRAYVSLDGTLAHIEVKDEDSAGGGRAAGGGGGGRVRAPPTGGARRRPPRARGRSRTARTQPPTLTRRARATICRPTALCASLPAPSGSTPCRLATWRRRESRVAGFWPATFAAGWRTCASPCLRRHPWPRATSWRRWTPRSAMPRTRTRASSTTSTTAPRSPRWRSTCARPPAACTMRSASRASTPRRPRAPATTCSCCTWRAPRRS